MGMRCFTIKRQHKMKGGQMLSYHVHPSSLKGNITVPASKSHTLRAILFAALAKGTSRIESFLQSPDTTAMIHAVRLLGAKVRVSEQHLEIEGFAGKPKPAKDVITCGNSGLTLRLVAAVAGLIPHYTVLTGDDSIRQNRVIQPLLEGLNQLGGFAVSALDNGYAPVIIKGPITLSKAFVDGEDSQPISGLLIAGSFASHPLELQVRNPGEKPFLALTLHWLRKLGISCHSSSDYTYFRTEGNAQVDGFTFNVPGDFSTAAFPLVAALITHSEITLHNIQMDDCQGDKAIIFLLQKMGAQFEIDEKRNTLTVKPGRKLQGIKADLNDTIDALPILAVLGCFAEGRTEFFNAAIARKKESDRISAITTELKKMGARIEEKADGLIIDPAPLHGAKLQAHQDHRLGMALTTAALAARTPSQILGVQCIDKTYLRFSEDYRAIGAQVVNFTVKTDGF